MTKGSNVLGIEELFSSIIYFLNPDKHINLKICGSNTWNIVLISKLEFIYFKF